MDEVRSYALRAAQRGRTILAGTRTSRGPDTYVFLPDLLVEAEAIEAWLRPLAVDDDNRIVAEDALNAALLGSPGSLDPFAIAEVLLEWLTSRPSPASPPPSPDRSTEPEPSSASSRSTEDGRAPAVLADRSSKSSMVGRAFMVDGGDGSGNGIIPGGGVA